MATKIAKKFYTSGAVTSLVQYSADALTDTVEAGIYELRASKIGYFLYKKCDNYIIPKLYGNIVKRASKIMGTFNSRDASTGVLLSGDKGTGKSLLSMLLSNISVNQGNPVIEINEAYFGADFEELMNAIPNAVLVFDEFGKKYKSDKDSGVDPQEHLLSFFDGASARKRLMIFTENKTSGINEFMLNRPGRIYYHYKYNKLTPDVISEYCEEVGISAEKVSFLQNYAINATEFSFDSLKAIVEEILRYPTEDVRELIEDLNITSGDASKDVKIVSVASSAGEEYIVHGKDEGVLSYRNNVYFHCLPKDEAKRKQELDRLQKYVQDHIKDNPEDKDDTDITDFMSQKSVSTSHKVLTTKDGVTYIKDNDGFIIGYKEQEKALPNYMGYMGEY